MSEKSIKKNFVFNLIYQLVVLLAPLVVTPYVSRVLGVDNIGLYSYSNSIVSYFLLVAVLGTATYGQRNIGYVQQNGEERSRTFWEVFILRALTSAITLGGYAVYVFCFAAEAERVIYIILALNILNVIVDITWFMQGMEEFGKTAVRSIIFRVLSVAFTFLFVKGESDLWIFVLISVGFTVLGNISLWLYLPKYLCRVGGIKPFRDIKAVIQLFLPSITIQIYTVLDKSMIGWFTEGYTENGYYEQSEKVIKIALTVVTALGTVMIPRISRLYKEGDHDRIVAYMYKSYRYVWMTAIPIMIGVIVVSDTFVPVFFGAGYEKCAVLMPIFSVLAVAIGLSNVTGMQYFVPIGKQNILTLTVVIGAVVNCILNLILIPFFGSVGASIASVIAELCVTVAGFVYVVKTKRFKLKPIFACSWKYLICGVVMGGIVALVNYFLDIGVWQLCLLVAIGVIVFIAMLFAVRDELLFEILGKARAYLRRIRNTQAVAVGTEAINESAATIESGSNEETSEPEIRNDRSGDGDVDTADRFEDGR